MSDCLDLRLQPQQARAFCTPATEVLYGGAAGGGKSHLMRVAAISWCLQIPGLQAYLFRRLFPELWRNHMTGPTSFPALLAPLTARSPTGRPPFCRIVKQVIRFANGSRIFLNHCQHEGDVLSFQGAEIHLLLIDELTHWTEYMYAFLRGRLRMAGLDIPERFRGTFPRGLYSANPGGIGHHWVKRRFVKTPYQLRKMGPRQGGMLRTFIPAKLSDNPALLRDDPHYADKLKGLGDPLLVRAMLEGDWKIVAGAMFGGVWRDERHTCPAFPIPLSWKLWRGADDGFASPAACYWLAQSPDTRTIFVVAELYAAGMLPETFATRVLAIDRSIRRSHGEQVLPNPHSLEGILDAAAFADTGQQDDRRQKVPSRGEIMNRMGCRWRKAEKPPGSRVHRVHEFHRLLAKNSRDPKGRPGIIFFEGCQHAIETIPTLPRDPHNPEDVDSSAEDHAWDAVSYGLQLVGSGFQNVKVRGT